MKTKNRNILTELNEHEILISLINLCQKYERRIEQLSEKSAKVLNTRLKVCRRKNTFQCFLVDVDTGKTKYVPKSNSTARKIAQSDYYSKLVPLLKNHLKLLKSVCNELEHNSVISVYDDLTSGRKELVIPDEIGAEEYSRKWLNVEYEQKAFVSDDTIFKTSNGLRVRSKSEILIAEELDRQGIPYRYEFPHSIMGNTFHPDFTILNVKTRREIVWEHFGLLDEPAYRDDFIRKLRLYESEGYILGFNLFFTAETSRIPLTRSDIVNVIKKITA